MTAPSEQDRRNADLRAAVAARQAAEYREAEAVAAEALGPGYRPWMKLVLLGSDYHRTGDTAPVAIAYKVYRGEQKTTENSVFVRRMPDGSVRSAAGYEPLFGDLLTEPHPSRTLEVRGVTVPAPRYSLCWSALELYTPQTAEQLAAARERREAKAVEDEARNSPLFADIIRQEGYVPPKRKGRKR